jgi:hypothetical protein
VLSKLPVPQLPLGDKLEAGAVEVVSFKPAFGRDSAVDETTKHLARDSDDALVLTDADADAELDGLRVAGFQRASSGKLKNIARPSAFEFGRECSYIVHTSTRITIG